MIEDSIVAEIRQYRAEHAARYDNDLTKICAALRQQEKQSSKEFVSFSPKRLHKNTEKSERNNMAK